MRERSPRPGGDARTRRPRSGAVGAPLAARPASRPRGARPAGGRRSGVGGPGTTTRTSAPRPGGGFTARAVILGVVLSALALSYVFPLRVYLAQQADIAELRAEQERQRAHVDELEREAALWSDEDYIRIQARQRLYYGEPDETLLLVPEEERPPPETGYDPDDPPSPPPVWWDTLWGGIREANHPGGGRPGPGGDPNAPQPEVGP